MNIWIGLGHIPQFNFYKQFILALAERGHRVYVSILGRGRLPQIVEHEIGGTPNVYLSVVGKHRMTKWSAIVDVNILLFLRLPFWLMGKHIDIAFSNGHHASIMSHLFGFPSYAFGDDPQTKIYPIMVKLATKNHSLIYEDPNHITLPGDTILRCTKEWAYLNPRTFKPNVKVLEKYGLQPKQYLFLREVSVGTVNYAAQSPQAILSISPLIQQFTKITYWGQSLLCNFKVLFSLEEKNRRSEYPADWILLQEPIEDIHSLMYYAAGLVSSGDSMAREAALLGIPAYYLGVRHSMPANLAAAKVAGLQNELTMPFSEWLNTLQGTPEELQKKQEVLREKINNDFIDINAYMLSLVNTHERLKNHQ